MQVSKFLKAALAVIGAGFLALMLGVIVLNEGCDFNVIELSSSPGRISKIKFDVQECKDGVDSGLYLDAGDFKESSGFTYSSIGAYSASDGDVLNTLPDLKIEWINDYKAIINIRGLFEYRLGSSQIKGIEIDLINRSDN